MHEIQCLGFLAKGKVAPTQLNFLATSDPTVFVNSYLYINYNDTQQRITIGGIKS